MSAASLDALRAAVRRLPPGATHVAVGLTVLGLSSYGFLLVSAHALTPASFAGLSVLYVLTYTVGPGVFLPFEQEVARALADRRARGQGSGPLLRRAGVLSLVVLLGLLILTAALSPILTPHLFDRSWVLFAGLLVSIVGLGISYLTRGVFAGNGNFRAYGVQLGLEGGSRLLACVVLAVIGVHAVGSYGLALSGAFLLALLCTARQVTGFDEDGPAAPWDEVTGAIGWLAVGALLSQALVNAGPVAVKLLAEHSDSAAAGQLLAGLVLARLPLFLFAAVQAALLPTLAAVLAVGDFRRFLSGLLRLVAVVAALSGLMTIVLACVGPAAMRVLFGHSFRLGRMDLVVLSIATGLYMAATVLGNGVLALKRFALAAAGWAIGMAVFIAVIAGPGSLLTRVEYSFLGGSLASAVAFALLLRAAARQRVDANSAGASDTPAVRS